MPSIKVISLEFGTDKFRKLSNMKIPISPRITVIAGPNGIGKSTILALLAHPSGLTNRPVDDIPLNYKKQENMSYMDKTFQANFNEIIHIDYFAEYTQKLGPPKTLSEPQVTYSVNEAESVVKACRLGPRPGVTNGPQLGRVVARTVKPTTSTFLSDDGTIIVGAAGKIPLPTLYLGMTRVLPVGEAEAGTASSTQSTMHVDDAKLIADFQNSVISGSKATSATITTQRIKNTGKVSGQPKHAFNPNCVSLGQDSIGSIALALASFKKLQREWTDYPGGLLIIDEVDSGLHPHAIQLLVDALKSQAKKLNLQIIATTHSPRLIEAVHPESEPLNRSPLDGIVYIRDPAYPKVLTSPSLKVVLDDMALVPPKPPAQMKKPQLPKLKIYFEDDEAAAVFKAVVPKAKLASLGKLYGVKIDPMPLGVGCENLASLGEHDPYFKEVVMVLDADASADPKNAKHSHIAKLPGDKYTGVMTGKENKDIVNRPLSPERTLLQYVAGIVNDPDGNAAALERLAKKNVTTQHLNAYILCNDPRVLADRVQMKNWWNNSLQHIADWELLVEWGIDRPKPVAAFLVALETAIAVVAKRIKTGLAKQQAIG